MRFPGRVAVSRMSTTIETTSMAFTPELHDRIGNSGVIAVLVIDCAEDAVALANALLAGGVDVMELTLRTPAALDALKQIKERVPQMMAGVGTILSPEQVQQVSAAGAAFGVAPGMNPRVVRQAIALGLSFAPGIATPSDIEQALECGCRLLKFFPAEASGGLPYLKNIAAPYAHLSIKYIPLGGLDTSKIEQYLQEPLVHALGGSWIAPRELIIKQDWEAITNNARRATQIIARVRKGTI